jgi:MFS family permease
MVELVCSVACATILSVASVAKLGRSEPARNRAVAVVELALVVLLAVGATRTVALAGTTALSAGFVGYTLATADRPCRCFGQRFRVTSQKARLFRSLGTFALAALGFVAALASSASTTLVATSVVVGLILGVIVIVLPSILTTIADPEVSV